MSNDQVKEKLQILFAEYAKNLPNKIAEIEKAWQKEKKHKDVEGFKTFHRLVHSLSGSAGTYGYVELGQSSQQLEFYLKTLLSSQALLPEQIDRIEDLIANLKKTYQQSVPELVPTIPTKNKLNNAGLIYILDKDNNFIVTINNIIKDAGYHLETMKDVSALLQALTNKLPTAIILDISFISEKNIRRLQAIKDSSVPLFCTSPQGDILSRLKALRLGNIIFFQKPIDPHYMVKTLDQYCGFTPEDSYKILIVDDSHSLAKYYSLVLQEAGMLTRYITNPLLLLEALEEFRPDLLLMDVYMPECTGFELAAVLRQEVQYMKIPIIFLSTEDNRSRQLSALNLGVDDFLTKPILPQHLIETVKSRAKRASVLNSFMMKDSLTGLLNHTNILQCLEHEFSRAKRQSENICFVMIDIDHFKKINDTYGHPVGDKVIRSLATLLSTSLRKTDIIGRYGGEEFALVMPNAVKEECMKVCNFLREKFSQIIYKANDLQFRVTLSAGIASYPPADQAKDLILYADQALYVAKNKGRNKIIAYESKSEIDLHYLK